MRPFVSVFFLLALSVPALAADPFDALTPEQRATAKRYLALANDDDWLTGLWISQSDAAMQQFLLFEKSQEGYSVSYYCPRFKLGWYPARAERGQDYVRVWNHDVHGGKISLPPEPMEVLSLKDDLLSAPRTSRLLNRTFRLVADKQWVIEPAAATFVTGRQWAEKEAKLQRRLMGVTEHYELIANGSGLLARRPPVRDLAVVQQEDAGEERYLLLRITMAYLPHSGQNGCVSHEGYYWAHLRRTNKTRWHIFDEWLFVTYVIAEGQSVRLLRPADGCIRFVEEDEDGKELTTYEINKPGISQRPVLRGK